MSRYRALLDQLDQLAPERPDKMGAEECSALLDALDAGILGEPDPHALLDQLDPDVLDEPDREMGADGCRDVLDALDGTL